MLSGNDSIGLLGGFPTMIMMMMMMTQASEQVSTEMVRRGQIRPFRKAH